MALHGAGPRGPAALGLPSPRVLPTAQQEPTAAAVLADGTPAASTASFVAPRASVRRSLTSIELFAAWPVRPQLLAVSEAEWPPRFPHRRDRLRELV